MADVSNEVAYPVIEPPKDDDSKELQLAKRTLEQFRMLIIELSDRYNSDGYGGRGHRVRKPGEMNGMGPKVWETTLMLVQKYGIIAVANAHEEIWSTSEHEQPWQYYDTDNAAISAAQDEIANLIERQMLNILDRIISDPGLPTPEEDYWHERKLLQAKIRRRKKVGDIDFELPAIPKKITEGSVRNILRAAMKFEQEYGYISQGRWRGMNR